MKNQRHLNGTNNAICKEQKVQFFIESIEFFRAIVDDATVKLTVYHNNSSSFSKGDFIGRAYVVLRDLHDYDQIHTK